jgi:hypothetical protein
MAEEIDDKETLADTNRRRAYMNFNLLGTSAILAVFLKPLKPSLKPRVVVPRSRPSW